MPALPPNSCPSGYSWYTCLESNFAGCCAVDACDYPDGCPSDSQLPGMKCRLNVFEPRLISKVGSSSAAATTPTIPVVTVTETSTITSGTLTPSASSTSPLSASSTNPASSNRATSSSTSTSSVSQAVTSVTSVPAASSLSTAVGPALLKSVTGTPLSSMATAATPSPTSTTQTTQKFSEPALGGIVTASTIAFIMLLCLLSFCRSNSGRRFRSRFSPSRFTAAHRRGSPIRRVFTEGIGMFPLHRRPQAHPMPPPNSTNIGSTAPIPVDDASSQKAPDSTTAAGLESAVVSPLTAQTAFPSHRSTMVSAITTPTVADPEPDPVPQLDSTAIVPRTELEGDTVSPVGRIAELPTDYADTLPELPTDSPRADSGVLDHTNRSDPNRPHVASWQNYEERPDSEDLCANLES